MISDSLHLTMLRVTGAVVVRHPGGQFEAHFDEPTQGASVGDIDVEATAPSLTARTIDVQGLNKDTPLEFTDRHGRDRSFRLLEQQPDGLGESRILLRL